MGRLVAGHLPPSGASGCPERPLRGSHRPRTWPPRDDVSRRPVAPRRRHAWSLDGRIAGPGKPIRHTWPLAGQVRAHPARIRHVASLDGQLRPGRTTRARRHERGGRIERTFCGQPDARPWTTSRPRWTIGPGRWTIGPGRWTTRPGTWTNATEARTPGHGAWTRSNPTCCDAIHRRTTTSCGFGLDHHPAAAYSSRVAPAPDDPRNPPGSGPTPRTGHRTDHRRRNDPTDDPAATRHPILVTADRQPDGAQARRTRPARHPGRGDAREKAPIRAAGSKRDPAGAGTEENGRHGAVSRGDPGHG
jgi:hypothetical protein